MGRGAAGRHQVCRTQPASSAGVHGDGRRHTRPRNGREHRDVHAPSRDAAQAAPESERRSDSLHPSAGARAQHGECTILHAGDCGHSFRCERAVPARRLLTILILDPGYRGSSYGHQCRCRERELLRCHGAAAGARPIDGHRGRRTVRGVGDGSLASLLDGTLRRRCGSDRTYDSPRQHPEHGHWRRAAGSAVSVRDRRAGQHRLQRSSPGRDHGDVAHASHDRSVRTTRSESRARAGARSGRSTRGQHAAGSSGGVSRQGRIRHRGDDASRSSERARDAHVLGPHGCRDLRVARRVRQRFESHAHARRGAGARDGRSCGARRRSRSSAPTASGGESRAGADRRRARDRRIARVVEAHHRRSPRN